jgi:5-formyltetrahydrofolate cyclo-ligase
MCYFDTVVNSNFVKFFMLTKDILRQKIVKIGDSQKICEQVLQMPEYLESASIYIFVSKPDEPNTRPIVENAWSSGKKVFVPIVVDETLGCVEWCSSDRLVVGKFGVLVPEGKDILQKVLVDIIFVPLVAFDQNKNRLGRGGGFYDRFLEHNLTLKVGLAFGSQRVDKVPTKNHDIPLDIIITD